LAAAVVAAAGVALGVLVRRHRAEALEDRRPGEVLRCDQLDLPALPLELAAERRGDLGVDLGDAGSAKVLEGLLGGRHRRHGNSPAPWRRTTGVSPVRSTTVEATPDRRPASTSAPQPARIRSGTSSRLAAAGSPGSFALVAA